jgi:hypothetical protein
LISSTWTSHPSFVRKTYIRYCPKLIISVQQVIFEQKEFGDRLALHNELLWFWLKIKITSLGAPRGDCIRVMISEVAISDNVQATAGDGDSTWLIDLWEEKRQWLVISRNIFASV